MKPDVDLIEAGNEIFSRQVAGYFVSAADARTQFASAMHELHLYSEPRQAVQLQLFELPEPVTPASRRNLQLV